MFDKKSNIVRLTEVLKDITDKMYWTSNSATEKLEALTKHSEYTNQSLRELIKREPLKEQ